MFKHLDVLICQVDSEVKLIGHLSRGQRSDDVDYLSGRLLLKVINIGIFLQIKAKVLADTENYFNILWVLVKQTSYAKFLVFHQIFTS